MQYNAKGHLRPRSCTEFSDFCSLDLRKFLCKYCSAGIGMAFELGHCRASKAKAMPIDGVTVHRNVIFRNFQFFT